MIGVGMLVLGVLWTLQLLPNLGALLKAAPVSGIVTIATLSGTIPVGGALEEGVRRGCFPLPAMRRASTSDFSDHRSRCPARPERAASAPLIDPSVVFSGFR